MFTKGMRTSATPEWATPSALFDTYDAEFGFDLDVCATSQNAKCRQFFDKETDGLAQTWAPRTCWMNPPYGREIGKWVAKARRESEAGATVVCLLPARTDTAWWHDNCFHGEIRFLRGRVHFNDKGPAPFPSAVVIFRPRKKEGVR